VTIVGGKPIIILDVDSVREGGRFVEVVANISTSALDKMSGERSAVMFVGLAGEVVR